MVFFSIVITVYNKADFIKNTINSVLNQTYKNFEIIVVNDGSTDASENIIRSIEDSRIKLINTKNQGASNARNTGINASKHTYIASLDGDDIWHRNYLSQITEAINEFPKEKIFATAVSQQYGAKIKNATYSFKQEKTLEVHNYFKSSRKFSLLTSSSVIFHKSILNKTGLYDPTIISGQDTDMWIRFGMYYKVVFINKPLVIYKHIASSLSNTKFELKNKPKFNKYFKEEKENPLLKSYLDLNRYSMAILSKLQNDEEHFTYYTSQLDTKNISLRQRLLLKSPKWLLKFLLKLKSFKGEKLYYPSN